MRPQKTIPFLSLAATPWWGLWLAAPPIGFLTSLWCPYGYSCASGILCSRLLFSHVHWPCHLGDGFSYVSALGADPFDFFLNSRSGAGRLWLGSRPYSWDPSSLTSVLSCLSARARCGAAASTHSHWYPLTLSFRRTTFVILYDFCFTNGCSSGAGLVGPGV